MSKQLAMVTFVNEDTKEEEVQYYDATMLRNLAAQVPVKGVYERTPVILDYASGTWKQGNWVVSKVTQVLGRITRSGIVVEGRDLPRRIAGGAPRPL